MQAQAMDEAHVSRAVWYCRFCGDRAVGIYSVPEGCFCYPDDREQALCPQHVIGATPIGGMEIIQDLTGGTWTKFMETY